MKSISKWLVLILLMALITTSAEAQFRAGVKAAFNYSAFRKSPNLKAGYQFGIAGKKYMGDLGWFFQPELNYSLEGVINQPLEVINIPLLLGFDFSDNFNIHFGYQSGFIIGTRGNETVDYKFYNPGLNIGIEFYPTERTVFGARYDYGLSDINESSIQSITFNFEVYLIFWLHK